MSHQLKFTNYNVNGYKTYKLGIKYGFIIFIIIYKLGPY